MLGHLRGIALGRTLRDDGPELWLRPDVESLRIVRQNLADNYDSAIIDASPLLPVADTLALLPFADAVALCIRSGQTTDEVADLAKTALQHPPDAAPVGVVVTGLSLHAHSYDGYVYTTRVVKSAPR